jgi:hypothetical protein
MSNSLDQNLQRQQQLAQSQAIKQAKVAKPDAATTVQFQDVLKSKQGSTTTLLKNNPVAANAVIKNAIGSNTGKSGKLSVAANANSNTAGSTSTSSSVSNNTTDAALTTGTTSADRLMAASQQMQEMNQEFNLQYLNLQENMQADSRQYTALSNVSKTKSDTAKNSLSNVK